MASSMGLAVRCMVRSPTFRSRIIRSIATPRTINLFSHAHSCSRSLSSRAPAIDAAAAVKDTNAKLAAADVLGVLDVVNIDPEGTLLKDTLSVKKLMKSLHAREILALGVPGNAQRRIAAPLLLPRGHSIFVSFGNIKAIIRSNTVTILEPQLTVVYQWVHDLADHLFKYGVSTGQSFQLFLLEDILKEMCNTFDRRMIIFGPLVNSLLLEVDSSMDAGEGFQKLLPLKDALYEFEMAVKEAQQCLLEILDNEEDMELLMHIAPPVQYSPLQNSAAATGDVITPDDAESILENYALRLSHSLNDILYLQQKVNSRQEIVELGMQIQRNRLLWANLHLGVMTVCMGFCTTLAGFFGMNIVHGLESEPYAFLIVVTGSIATALLLQIMIMRVVGNSSNIEKEQFKERRRLNSVLEDLPAVDMATKRAFSFTDTAKDRTLNLKNDEFLTLLTKARNTSPEDKRGTFDAITELFGSKGDKRDADEWHEIDEFSGVLPPPRKKRKKYF